MKNAKKILIFGENDSRCLSNFLQTRVFESLIKFLKLKIKLITGILDLQK